MLIVFGGLPGTGKTTVSRSLARRLGATHLRIDVIEQANLASGVPAVSLGASGYAVAQAVAEANVGDERRVVVDCVIPVAASRSGWRSVAERTKRPLVEVEVICSDVDEHRRRVTTRIADIPGQTQTSWEQVAMLDYEPWDRPHLIVDTAFLTPDAAVDAILQTLPCSRSTARQATRRACRPLRLRRRSAEERPMHRRQGTRPSSRAASSAGA